MKGAGGWSPPVARTAFFRLESKRSAWHKDPDAPRRARPAFRRAGDIVTLRRIGRSGSVDAGRRSHSRMIVWSATRISSWANAAPMQRRVPPPNGTHE